MATERDTVVVGIDVGTSGVRTVIANAAGTVLSESKAPLTDSITGDHGHEQHPENWWSALCLTIQAAMHELTKSQAPTRVAGVAVTSTSGSLVLVDNLGNPLRPAIMYDDARATELARQLSESMKGINASYSLAKAAWVREHEPNVWRSVRHVLHPGDWLTGKLTGSFNTTDTSSALKLGYCPDTNDWDPGVAAIGFDSGLLPRVTQPGAQVGCVSNRASTETGFPVGTPVLAGATDGMTSLIASGASAPGDANTTLGTTLVWKVLARAKPKLEAGMYCHRHPGNMWAPGAASNTGPGCLHLADATNLEDLDRRASRQLPSPILGYYLAARGERFPFLNSQAETFVEGEAKDAAASHAAQLQSLAFIERWGYERLAACGVAVGNKVFSAGGAARSSVYAQLRADVMNRCVVRMRHPHSAFGAAILAATGTLFDGNIVAAATGMTNEEEQFAPNQEVRGRFEPVYHAFREACAKRGYE